MTKQNAKTCFSSFQELGRAYGIKVKDKKRTSDKKKLAKQREDFSGRHTCRACGKPLVYKAGTNLMVCENPECKGIKVEFKTKAGEQKCKYLPSYYLLHGKSAAIAENIFD